MLSINRKILCARFCFYSNSHIFSYPVVFWIVSTCHYSVQSIFDIISLKRILHLEPTGSVTLESHFSLQFLFSIIYLLALTGIKSIGFLCFFVLPTELCFESQNLKVCVSKIRIEKGAQVIFCSDLFSFTLFFVIDSIKNGSTQLQRLNTRHIIVYFKAWRTEIHISHISVWIVWTNLKADIILYIKHLPWASLCSNTFQFITFLFLRISFVTFPFMFKPKKP